MPPHLPMRTASSSSAAWVRARRWRPFRRACDILVATPGRLEDLHNQGFIDVSQLEIFVLDEADRMLDMGFIHDVQQDPHAGCPPKSRPCSSPPPCPRRSLQLVDSLLHDPVKIAVDPVSSPVEVIDQSVYLVDKNNKTKLLVKLVNDKSIPSALVFTRTKHGANRVAQDLTKAGITAAAIHGNKSQTARQAALAGLQGRLRPGAGGHRHRRPRTGHRVAGLCVQLQPARGTRDLRPPHRPHRPGR